MKFLFTLLASILFFPHAHAAQVSVAVAANFTKVAQELQQQFEAESEHSVSLSFGSTGSLYAQVINGAPFDIFLAADARRPSLLVEEGLVDSEQHFTYAIGQLVLWSKQGYGEDVQQALYNPQDFEHIVIANPKTAPYGEQALAVMEALGVYGSLQASVVESNNIAQTYQYIEGGIVDLGFVALSQVIKSQTMTPEYAWVVPQELYAPIKQDAVLLKTSEDNPAAQAFFEFLRSEQALNTIHSYGYRTGGE
ncbi:molybdate ABC transporter substrate-binding protein [Aliagarivorans marinus]|uniref:molybdate ABC transporter substrate-binding protein n=1 Tax=Aliagarivorans marinus TaxID=561965 RepID=UPI00040DC072|nr:molybdate ABC transporter substrate-binding protein [Aliagarivorans marinus]